jgi:asparagine synthase (glutamine-hydrolysing)
VLPYWDWDYPPAREHADGSPREWVERLRESLEEAVRLRLRADVPVGCYLSGGLDSCATLGLAARCAPGRLRAYTVSFDDPDYDEADIASEQAELAGAELCRVDVSSQDLAEHFAGAIYHAERPLGNAHGIAKYLLSRAVRRSGLKVVLTGEGSDEILAGYPHFRRDHLLYERNGNDAAARARLLAELEADNRVSAGTLLPSGATPLAGVQAILGYVPSHLEVWAQIAASLTGLLRPDVSDAFAGRDTFRVMLGCLDVERQLRGRSSVNQSLYVWGKTMLPNYILSTIGDRMEMAHSVEGRLPFMDHEVAAVAAAMPVELKIHGMTEKYALREAARDVLTDTVYRRQKHPFMSPPATLDVNGPLFTFLQDTLRGAALDGPGIYDRAKVVALLDSVPSMTPAERMTTDLALMWITSICLLQGALVDRQGRRPFNPSLSDA